MEYAHKTGSDMAKASNSSAPISTKVAIEISNHLRGMNTKKAKLFLEKVLKKEAAVPYKRFTEGAGHKPGKVGPGKYPQKASEEFLNLIKTAENNAENQGLSDDLIIKHLVANKAGNNFRYGRKARRKFKRTHLQIILQEEQKE